MKKNVFYSVQVIEKGRRSWHGKWMTRTIKDAKRWYKYESQGGNESVRAVRIVKVTETKTTVEEVVG